ncbi:hypothetical protein OIO90_006543 [Microbotryomycetes sp. JL221]|nr:hypothetical protein OIO90_006543 [Microbotryomycetes sp. JL221]
MSPHHQKKDTPSAKATTRRILDLTRDDDERRIQVWDARSDSLRIKTPLKVTHSFSDASVKQKARAWEAAGPQSQATAGRSHLSPPAVAAGTKTQMAPRGTSFAPQDPELKKRLGQNSGRHNGYWVSPNFEDDTGSSQARRQHSNHKAAIKLPAPTFNNANQRRAGSQAQASYPGYSKSTAKLSQDTVAHKIYKPTATVKPRDTKGKGKAPVIDLDDDDDDSGLQLRGVEFDEIEDADEKGSGSMHSKNRNGQTSRIQHRNKGPASSEDELSLRQSSAVSDTSKLARNVKSSVVQRMQAKLSREDKQKAASSGTADKEIEFILPATNNVNVSQELPLTTLMFDNKFPSTNSQYALAIDCGNLEKPSTHAVSLMRKRGGNVLTFRRKDVALVEMGFSSTPRLVRSDFSFSSSVSFHFHQTAATLELARTLANECGSSKTEPDDAEDAMCLRVYAREHNSGLLALLETWSSKPDEVKVKYDGAPLQRGEPRSPPGAPPTSSKTTRSKPIKSHRPRDQRPEPTASVYEKRRSDSDYAQAQQPVKTGSAEEPSRRRSARPSTSQYANSTLRQAAEVDSTPNDKVVLEFKKGQAGALTLTHGDLKRLSDDEFLNDTLIDFGMKRIVDNLSLQPNNKDIADQVHVFSPYFFKKLTQKRKLTGKDGAPIDNYTAIRKWTQRSNLFDKRFIIVPINEHMHWYLAIIVNPGCLLLHAVEKLEEPPTRATRQSLAKEAVNVVTPSISPDATSPAATQQDDMVIDSPADLSLPLESTQRVDTRETRVSGSEEAVAEALGLASADQVTKSAETPVENTNSEFQDFVDSEPSHEPRESSKLLEPTLESKSATLAPQRKPIPIFPSTHAPDVLSPPLPSGWSKQPSILIDESPATESDDVDLENERCYIFVFDSLGNTHPAVSRRLRDYLLREAEDKRGVLVDPKWAEGGGIQGITVNVPLQTNFSDCGLYILHYVEKFLSAPRDLTNFALTSQKQRGRTKNDARTDAQVLDMWAGNVALHKRQVMREEINKLSQEWVRDQEPIMAQQAKERDEKARRKREREEEEGSTRPTLNDVDSSKTTQSSGTSQATRGATAPKPKLVRGRKLLETVVLSDDDESDSEVSDGPNAGAKLGSSGANNNHGSMLPHQPSQTAAGSHGQSNLVGSSTLVPTHDSTEQTTDGRTCGSPQHSSVALVESTHHEKTVLEEHGLHNEQGVVESPFFKTSGSRAPSEDKATPMDVGVETPALQGNGTESTNQQPQSPDRRRKRRKRQASTTGPFGGGSGPEPNLLASNVSMARVMDDSLAPAGFREATDPQSDPPQLADPPVTDVKQTRLPGHDCSDRRYPTQIVTISDDSTV